MIIYFADRNLNITGNASTSLPGGFRISDDLLSESLETGVNIFTLRISYNDLTREELETKAIAGNFILKSGGHAFSDKENTYDSLFQIIETEFDTKSQELYIYTEDAGLDLLNNIVSAGDQTSKTLEQMLSAYVPSDWTLNLVGTPTDTNSITWDGESTCTERINSIVNLFDCEVYYSFIIERFQITAKVVNVVTKRGNQIATPQLRLDLDIDRIVTKSSIADLATAFSVTGGTPDGGDTPIDLKNYTYSYTDPVTGDVYSVDETTGRMRNTSAMKRWASAIDTDGLIVKTYSYNTTDKAVLAGQARAELQKRSKLNVEYEVDFNRLPDGTAVGDRINIIDEHGKLYLEARILKIETSVANETQTATIGDYILRSPGISAVIEAMAKEFADKVKNGTNGITIGITSSDGNIFHNRAIQTTLVATIFFGEIVINNQSDLEQYFGDTALINWYNLDGQLVQSGFTLNVNSQNKTEKYLVRLVT